MHPSGWRPTSNELLPHYNRKVRSRAFKVGTLVLRKVIENTVEQGAGKVQENWERPYIVSKIGDSRAYHLQMLDGTPLLHIAPHGPLVFQLIEIGLPQLNNTNGPCSKSNHMR